MPVHTNPSAEEMVLNAYKVDVSGVCSFPVLLAMVGDSSISTGEISGVYICLF